MCGREAATGIILVVYFDVDLRNKGITGRPERSTLDEVKARLQKKRMELLMKQQKLKKQSNEVAGMDYAAEEDDEGEKEKVEAEKRIEADQTQNASKKSDSESDSDDDDPYKKLGLPMSFK